MQVKAGTKKLYMREKMVFWVNHWLVCSKRKMMEKKKRKRIVICEIGGRRNAEGDEVCCIQNYVSTGMPQTIAV